MSRPRFYQFIIAGLLVSNIILLCFLFFGKKKHGHTNGKNLRPKNIIIDRLGFSQDQIKEYEKLIKSHKAGVSNNAAQIAVLKNKLYGILSNNQIDSVQVDSLQEALSKAKANIEQLHFTHFMDIKKLCSAKQRPKFNELTEDLGKLFAPGRRFKRKHK